MASLHPTFDLQPSTPVNVYRTRAEQKVIETARTELLDETSKLRSGEHQPSEQLLDRLASDIAVIEHTDDTVAASRRLAADTLVQAAYNLGTINDPEAAMLSKLLSERAIDRLREVFPTNTPLEAVNKTNNLEVAVATWVLEHPDPNLSYYAAVDIAAATYKKENGWSPPDTRLRVIEATGEVPVNPFEDDPDYSVSNTDKNTRLHKVKLSIGRITIWLKAHVLIP